MARSVLYEDIQILSEDPTFWLNARKQTSEGSMSEHRDNYLLTHKHCFRFYD
jgi:hypothetical protein